jgi:hypothetical protein
LIPGELRKGGWVIMRRSRIPMAFRIHKVKKVTCPICRQYRLPSDFLSKETDPPGSLGWCSSCKKRKMKKIRKAILQNNTKKLKKLLKAKNIDFSVRKTKGKRRDSRFSSQYNVWRNSVIKRFNNVCVKCGSKQSIHCHHIFSWHDYPKLRFVVDNGICLCRDCHEWVHGFKFKKLWWKVVSK